MANRSNQGVAAIRSEVQKEATSQAARALVAGVVIVVLAAGAGWWFYLKPKFVDLAGGVPSGAVVAFERINCPNGWQEYKKLYGRFIRGIDRSNEYIDPDGERGIGGIQVDLIAAHWHALPGEAWSFDGNGSNQDPSNPNGGAGFRRTMETGGAETRPKNVALLFCVRE